MSAVPTESDVVGAESAENMASDNLARAKASRPSYSIEVTHGSAETALVPAAAREAALQLRKVMPSYFAKLAPNPPKFYEELPSTLVADLYRGTRRTVSLILVLSGIIGVVAGVIMFHVSGALAGVVAYATGVIAGRVTARISVRRHEGNLLAPPRVPELDRPRV